MRIFAMFLIIFHHLCQHGLWFNPNEPYPQNYFIGNCLWNWTGMLGNWLFVLVSGYFVSLSTFSWKKVFKLWLQIFSISAIIGIILYFSKIPLIGFQNDKYQELGFFAAARPMTLKDLARSLLPTLCANNWFAAAYIGFYFFVPFLNLSLKYLDKRTHRNLLVTMIILGTVLPMIWFQSLFAVSSLYYFILGFYISSYVRIYEPSFLKNNRRNFIISVTFCLLFSVWKYCILKYGPYIPYIKTHMGSTWENYPFGGLNKLPILICAIFTFGFFKNLKLSYNKIINIIASTTFGVYLIHENLLLNKIIWHRILKIDNWMHSPFLIPYMILCVLLVFLSCSIIELLRRNIIDKPIMAFVNKRL